MLFQLMVACIYTNLTIIIALSNSIDTYFVLKVFYDLRKSSAPHPLTSPPQKEKGITIGSFLFFLASTTVNWLTVLYDNLN